MVAPLIAATLALVSCAAPAPTPVVQVVTKEVPKEVVVTQEVSKEVIVTKEVVKEVSKARPKVTMWLEGTFFDSGSQALLKSQAQDHTQQMGFDLESVQDATATMQPRENRRDRKPEPA